MMGSATPKYPDMDTVLVYEGLQRRIVPIGEFLGTVNDEGQDFDIYLSKNREWVCYARAFDIHAASVEHFEEELVEEFAELIRPLLMRAVDPSISPLSK